MNGFKWDEFDANSVEPAQDRGVMPPGDYQAVIIDSEMKPTRERGGEYLELTFQIIEGPMENRQVWHRMNLVNQNETAVRIARAELSTICRCVGVMQPKDSSDLHDKPLIIRVGVRRDDAQRNEIKGFKPANGQQQPAQQPAQPAQQARPAATRPATTPTAAAPAAGAETKPPPPWRRNR